MASPHYADLTGSNYDEAYEWIKAAGLLGQRDSEVPPNLRVLRAALAAEGSGLGEMAMESISSPGLLPTPVLDAARLLKVPDSDAWQVTVAAKYKIDLERRCRIGSFGELALVRLLEQAGLSVYHGSVESDALGWDVMASHEGLTRHIEVKSTTGLSRLRVYLSRHEYDVSTVDPEWLLAVVLIAEDGRLRRFAHLRSGVLSRVVPVDSAGRGKWQLCSIDLQQADLVRGLPFECATLPQNGVATASDEPIWWPTT